MISATHTHSPTTARGRNPLVRDGELTEYQTLLSRRIADEHPAGRSLPYSGGKVSGIGDCP